MRYISQIVQLIRTRRYSNIEHERSLYYPDRTLSLANCIRALLFSSLIFIAGEDPMLSDQQQYRYMTVDDMKSMGDDSMRVNVTDDERDNRHSGGK